MMIDPDTMAECYKEAYEIWQKAVMKIMEVDGSPQYTPPILSANTIAMLTPLALEIYHLRP